MRAALGRGLIGLALVATSTVEAVDATPPTNWPLEFVDADGNVVLSTAPAAGAVTVETTAGPVVTTSVTSVEVSGATTRWNMATDDPDVAVDVVADAAGDSVTLVAIEPVTSNTDFVMGISVDFVAIEGDRFFGLGQRADAVDHRGASVVNRVSDGPWTATQLDVIASLVPAAGFSDRPDATYFPVPWVLSTSGYGVLVDNDETSRFDLATSDDPGSWTIDVAADRVQFRVFTGATPAATLGRMTAAVGRQPEPVSPYLFGPWWQAADDEAVELAALADAGVPMSVAQTYTHYLPCGDHLGRATEERERVDDLHDAGLAVTTYVNPMVCVGYRSVYVPGSLGRAFHLDATGRAYRYRYYTSTFFDVVQFDFSSPAGVGLFHDVLDEAVANGYDGWMEDFGEYTPDDVVSADGTPGPAMHNRYPELYHAAGWDYAQSAPRPLLRFNRSGWTDAIASSQVVWGGDPTTTWGFDGLESAVRSGLGMGLSGVSLWGSDIGGFFTWVGEQPTPELLARWTEFGAFSGVMRLQAGGVSLVEQARPTVLDPGVLDVWRRYSQLRTQLYPYIAGSEDAYDSMGLPLMRHHVLATPDDATAVDLDNQYLFGADLLVAPVLEPGAGSRFVYLPDGDWVEWWPSVEMSVDGTIALGAAHRHRGRQALTVGAPLGEIPVFVRSGAVIPLLPRDVETLAPYGAEGVVGLDDRDDQRTILAFPDDAWTGPLGPGETVSSTVEVDRWELRVDGSTARTYAIQASLGGLREDFTPCAVTADGADIPFGYDAESHVLTTTADLGQSGVVVAVSCAR